MQAPCGFQQDGTENINPVQNPVQSTQKQQIRKMENAVNQ